MEVLIFKQQTCKPCKDLTNFLTLGLNVDMTKIKQVYIDDGEDESIELATQYGIMTTPVTILLDDNGNEQERVFGADNNSKHAVATILGIAGVI